MCSNTMKHVDLDCASCSGKLDCDAEELCAFSVVDVPLSVLQEDLAAEQQADPSLRGLFKKVLAADEVRNSSQGYFKQNNMLMQKWLPPGD